MGLPRTRRRPPLTRDEGLECERLKRGLTQEELAKRAGVGQSVIAMIERLRRPDPRWSTVAKLSTVLRVSPYTLFGTPPLPRRRDADL